MVIETAVVGALALHVLLDVLELPLAGLELPMKELQLPAGAFDSVPAPVYFYLPGLRQGEPGLTEAEGLCERGDTAVSGRNC